MPKSNKITNKFNHGFTMVELLLVVSIIGILSGAMVTLIDPIRQKNISQDAVNKGNMLKLAESIEAYYIAAGLSQYPPLADLTNENVPTVTKGSWTQLSQQGIVYTTSTSQDNFCLCIPSKKDSSKYFLYKSSSEAKTLEELVGSCPTTCN